MVNFDDDGGDISVRYEKMDGDLNLGSSFRQQMQMEDGCFVLSIYILGLRFGATILENLHLYRY